MRRVRPGPADKAAVFHALKLGDDKLNFESYADIFTLAACLGYAKGEGPLPLKKAGKDPEPMRWEAFGDYQQSVLKMIALAKTEDPKILVEGDEQGDKMLQIVEEYANRGLEILQRKVVEQEDRGLERLDIIVELLMWAYEAEDVEKDILRDMME